MRLMIISLNLKMGDLMIESEVRRIDGNFFMNLGPTAD